MISRTLSLVFSILLISTLGIGSGHAQTLSLICDSSFSAPRSPDVSANTYPITHLPSVVLIRFDGKYYRLSMVHTKEFNDDKVQMDPASNGVMPRLNGDFFKKKFVTLTNVGVNDDTIWWSDSFYGEAKLNRHTLRISGSKTGVGRFGAQECVKVPDESYDTVFTAFTDMIAEYNEAVTSSIEHQRKALSIVSKLSNGI